MYVLDKIADVERMEEEQKPGLVYVKPNFSLGMQQRTEIGTYKHTGGGYWKENGSISRDDILLDSPDGDGRIQVAATHDPAVVRVVFTNRMNERESLALARKSLGITDPEINQRLDAESKWLLEREMQKAEQEEGAAAEEEKQHGAVKSAPAAAPEKTSVAALLGIGTGKAMPRNAMVRKIQAALVRLDKKYAKIMGYTDLEEKDVS